MARKTKARHNGYLHDATLLPTSSRCYSSTSSVDKRRNRLVSPLTTQRNRNTKFSVRGGGRRPRRVSHATTGKIAWTRVKPCAMSLAQHLPRQATRSTWVKPHASLKPNPSSFRIGQTICFPPPYAVASSSDDNSMASSPACSAATTTSSKWTEYASRGQPDIAECLV